MKEMLKTAASAAKKIDVNGINETLKDTVKEEASNVFFLAKLYMYGGLAIGGLVIVGLVAGILKLFGAF